MGESNDVPLDAETLKIPSAGVDVSESAIPVNVPPNMPKVSRYGRTVQRPSGLNVFNVINVFEIPCQHHGPKLRDPPLRFEKRPALVFFELFLFPSFFFFCFGFPGLLKHQGQSISPPHAFSLVGTYESILEPQLIRAHWRIIRQSSSPLVSSQTSRCPTHAPMAEHLRSTVVVLPPLRTIRLCVCKATVSCLGSDLVHSSIARLLFA
ncbi:uncharacterized protein TNCV_1770311 [Trichonephila clavipes]|nr:uncharacterized protein TNCV_1770311 [Trichonephila clavipes]